MSPRHHAALTLELGGNEPHNQPGRILDAVSTECDWQPRTYSREIVIARAHLAIARALRRRNDPDCRCHHPRSAHIAGQCCRDCWCVHYREAA